jgi:hypothetical protein
MTYAVCGFRGRAFAFLCFAHLAETAFLALSLRSSAVILAALAGPPLRPPLRPKATAYGFFFGGFGMPEVYVSGQENKSLFLPRFPLTLT